MVSQARVVLVDDGSSDITLDIGRELALEIFVHDKNYDYGANQKTCYTEALRAVRRPGGDDPGGPHGQLPSRTRLQSPASVGALRFPPNEDR